MKLLRFLSPLAAFAAFTSAKATDLKVDALLWQAGNALVIEFADDGTGDADAFTVQHSADLASGSWTNSSGVTFAPKPGGGWRATVPRDPGAQMGYFRVFKNGEPVTAVFASQTGSVSEGGGSTVTVQFSAPFTGTLKYTVDYGDGNGPQAGEIDVAGSTAAQIPISALTDDKSAFALNYITLRLSADGGNGYRPVGIGTTLIVLDNDALWGGILDTGNDDVDIAVRMLTTQQGQTKAACIKTGGAGLLPPNPQGDGDWLFSSFELTSTLFEGTVGPIVIPASETIYGADTHVSLAMTTAGGGSVTGSKLEGSFALTSTVPGLPHLTFPDRTGNFVFVRQAATPKDLEAPASVPAP